MWCNQPLKALHNDWWCECYWKAVIESVCGGILGYKNDCGSFRQDGTAACVSEWLKTMVKTLESWLAHALSNFPGTPSGPVAFLGFTALSPCLPSCSCKVIVGGFQSGWADVVCLCFALVSRSLKRKSLAPLLDTRRAMNRYCFCGHAKYLWRAEERRPTLQVIGEQEKR